MPNMTNASSRGAFSFLGHLQKKSDYSLSLPIRSVRHSWHPRIVHHLQAFYFQRRLSRRFGTNVTWIIIMCKWKHQEWIEPTEGTIVFVHPCIQTTASGQGRSLYYCPWFHRCRYPQEPKFRLQLAHQTECWYWLQSYKYQGNRSLPVCTRPRFCSVSEILLI